MPLTYAVGVRVVGEVPLRVVAEGVDEVAPRNVRLEDEALGAREGDVVEVGGDAADAALVVRREVDLTRPGAVGHRGGEEGVRLEGRGVLLSGFFTPPPSCAFMYILFLSKFFRPPPTQ